MTRREMDVSGVKTGYIVDKIYNRDYWLLKQHNSKALFFRGGGNPKQNKTSALTYQTTWLWISVKEVRVTSLGGQRATHPKYRVEEEK